MGWKEGKWDRQGGRSQCTTLQTLGLESVPVMTPWHQTIHQMAMSIRCCTDMCWCTHYWGDAFLLVSAFIFWHRSYGGWPDTRYYPGAKDKDICLSLNWFKVKKISNITRLLMSNGLTTNTAGTARLVCVELLKELQLGFFKFPSEVQVCERIIRPEVLRQDLLILGTPHQSKIHKILNVAEHKNFYQYL